MNKYTMSHYQSAKCGVPRGPITGKHKLRGATNTIVWRKRGQVRVVKQFQTNMFWVFFKKGGIIAEDFFVIWNWFQTFDAVTEKVCLPTSSLVLASRCHHENHNFDIQVICLTNTRPNHSNHSSINELLISHNTHSLRELNFSIRQTWL